MKEFKTNEQTEDLKKKVTSIKHKVMHIVTCYKKYELKLLLDNAVNVSKYIDISTTVGNFVISI